MPPGKANGLACFGKFNQHLLLDVRPFTEILPLLSLCTAVRNLAFYSGTDPSLMPYLDRLRPFRLSIDAGTLFSGPPDFCHPIFGNLTHLDITDAHVSTYTDESWRSLASLPCLSSTAFRMLLRECKLLQTLILVIFAQDLVLEEWENHAQLLPLTYPTHDPRFIIAAVLDYMADWMCGAWGGADIWVRADNFIRMKQRGDIPSRSSILSAQYQPPHLPFTEDRCLLPDGQ
ncbi:hypothetical protein C8J57DRAFT_1525754 [Mycena rebaudengoi]|nr:hypothetical protein C8J57DRAFT_1525754 [Mycena rebaudengoi]